MDKSISALPFEPTQDIPASVENPRAGVSYPEFKKYTYFSRTAGRDTPVNILLPNDIKRGERLPVLYVLHGYFDNEDWMARDCVGIRHILTNLCLDGEAERMAVVLPYIYCSKDMPTVTGMNLKNSLNYDNFINDLLTDLMPFVEKSFPVKTGRENTAITGFSMGGRESLFIGFRHPELFGYVGAVCPAPGLVEIPNNADHPGQMTEAEMRFDGVAPKRMFISASDSDSVVGLFPKSYHDILEGNGVAHVWQILHGCRHDHTSVRPHLYNYFRAVFR